MKFLLTNIVILSLALSLNASVLSNSRIFTGDVASADTAPYSVYIVSSNVIPPLGTAATGSGTIVSAKHVITSAKLIKSYQQFQVGYGSLLLNSLIYKISNIASYHPAYSGVANDANDIGIISFPANSFASKAVLPVLGTPWPAIVGVPIITVSGFGGTAPATYSASLRYVTLTPVGNCIVAPVLPVSNINFCTETTLKGICAGDRGAGAIAKLADVNTLVGVVVGIRTTYDGVDITDCQAGKAQLNRFVNIYDTAILPWVHSIVDQ